MIDRGVIEFAKRERGANVLAGVLMKQLVYRLRY